MKTQIDQDAGLLGDLSALPIEVAEAMYSPDFVELTTLGAGGVPLVLPMSFTLDLPGNGVRFSSPLTAARLANLARDPRCAVSFSRVTTGHPAVLLQGIATLGEVAEGVRRGPARRFTVAPVRLLLLDEPVQRWRFPASPQPPVPAPTPDEGGAPRTVSPAPVAPADLEALVRFPTTVAALCDEDGWPLAAPVEVARDGEHLTAHLPELGGLAPRAGPASLLGHTWTKEGPRFLALTGRATLRGAALRFLPGRALRRL